AQTPDRRQPQCGVAVFCSPQHQPQKKICTRRGRSVRTAPARARAGCAGRASFTRHRQGLFTETPPHTRLCGHAVLPPPRDRHATHGHWQTITFVGGLRQRGMSAPFVLEGAINGPMSLAYVKQCLVPTLKRGEIVLMDHLPVHKVAGIAEAIEAAGATLIYLPK